MRTNRHIPLAIVAVLGSVILSGCANLPTLPNDAAAAVGAHHPEADATYGQATTGQFQ